MTTSFTIHVTYTLAELKEKYRVHLGYPKNKKVSKSDIASWLGSLAESDVRDMGGYDDDLEDF